MNNVNTIKEKIKRDGYWEIVIQLKSSDNADDLLITELPICKKIVEESRVILRGWDYPHIDTSGVFSLNNGVFSFCDWPEGPMYEYWDLSRLGIFTHYFALREDLRMKDEQKKFFKSDFDVPNVEKFLDILSTLYTVTEVMEFTKNLTLKLKEVTDVDISIKLHKADNRMLVFWGNFGRHLSRPYVSVIDTVESRKDNISKEELIESSSDIAIDITKEIFHQFNWDNVNMDIFKEDQRKLLERRL